MNSIMLKTTSRGLTLCALLVVSNFANGQWNFDRVETLTDEAENSEDFG